MSDKYANLHIIYYDFFSKERKPASDGIPDDSELQREMYRKPRDALLTLSATFLELVAPRLRELSKLTGSGSGGGEHMKIVEPLDHKCHVVSEYLYSFYHYLFTK